MHPHGVPTPTREELYADIAARNEREERLDARTRRWFWVRAILLCWMWALIGLFLGAFAFHTTDAELGHISMLAGELVTLVGVLGTVAWAVHESAKRGWR